MLDYAKGGGYRSLYVGMFNRLRVEPACYRVVIFTHDGSNRVAHMLGMQELERMQAHLVYDGRTHIVSPQVLADGRVSND